VIRTFLLIIAGVALIGWGASSFAEIGSTSDRGGIVSEFADGAREALDEITAGASGPASEAPGTLRIADTDGSGVAIRSDCADEARSGGALPEGALVTAVTIGEGSCEGWTLVEHEPSPGATPLEAWVRDAYLEVVTPAE
jgi:hypothetical protein